MPGPEISLRPLALADAAVACAIFRAAVAATAPAYDAAQRSAWAAGLPDEAAWRARLDGLEGLLALRGDRPVGFMALGAEGYLDLAFVAPEAARQGVGSALLAGIEEIVRARGITRMTTQASLVAKPFFARHGWQVETRQSVERQGVTLTNFRMWKDLDAAPSPR